MADGDEQPKKRQRSVSGEQECQNLELAQASGASTINSSSAQQDVEMILQDWIIGGTAVAGVRLNRGALESVGSPLPWQLLMRRACGVCPQKLNLCHQEIGPAGAKRLGLALASGVCDGMQTLDLRANNIGDIGIIWVSLGDEVAGEQA